VTQDENENKKFSLSPQSLYIMEKGNNNKEQLKEESFCKLLLPQVE